MINTDHLDQSIEQPDIVAAKDPKFVKYPAGKYDVANPHPGYGIDPNILNEYGHTKYPMWVKTADGQSTLVNNAEEETALTGKPVDNKPVKPAESWT